MNRFIGREKELEGLKGLLDKRTSSLVSIRGRRRIGKSRLAEEFSREFESSYFLTGVPPTTATTAQDQRDEFARQLEELGAPNRRGKDDWFPLLWDLADHTASGRILIVFDEITWMGSKDHSFLGKLKTVWDTHFKKNPKLLLIISGSNSAWIEKNILSSTGFVGRFSHYLHLKDLPLPKCDEFWGDHRLQIAPYEKFKILAVTGGVPRYLEEIRNNRSAEKNLHRICYQPEGLLFTEFDTIFSDLFERRSGIYKRILGNMTNGRVTMKELAQTLNVGIGGDLSEYLGELVETGFLARDVRWNIKEQRSERLSHYRICDNYVRFYLKYIEPHHEEILAGKMHDLPSGWNSILGLQFESLVANNWQSLFRAIDLDPRDTVWSGGYIQTPTARREGCQIDYLIQTKHRGLYICEVKFCAEKIGKSVIKEVAEKSRKLVKPRGFSVRHVLIHVNGVTEQVEWENFFSDIVDFGQLLS